ARLEDRFLPDPRSAGVEGLEGLDLDHEPGVHPFVGRELDLEPGRLPFDDPPLGDVADAEQARALAIDLPHARRPADVQDLLGERDPVGRVRHVRVEIPHIAGGSIDVDRGSDSPHGGQATAARRAPRYAMAFGDAYSRPVRGPFLLDALRLHHRSTNDPVACGATAARPPKP